MTNYENQSGQYRLLFQLENAEIGVIASVESLLKAHQAENTLVKVAQSHA